MEPVSETDVQAVGKQVAATKFSCVAKQFIERESDCGIVGSNNCARARADDDVDGDVVRDKLLQDADVTCAAEASAAQHHRDANCRICIRLMGVADSGQRPQ
jgi:hypothetical protein